MENIIDYFTFGVVQLREILQVNALHKGLFYDNTPNDVDWIIKYYTMFAREAMHVRKKNRLFKEKK